MYKCKRFMLAVLVLSISVVGCTKESDIVDAVEDAAPDVELVPLLESSGEALENASEFAPSLIGCQIVKGNCRTQSIVNAGNCCKDKFTICKDADYIDSELEPLAKTE